MKSLLVFSVFVVLVSVFVRVEGGIPCPDPDPDVAFCTDFVNTLKEKVMNCVRDRTADKGRPQIEINVDCGNLCLDVLTNEEDLKKLNALLKLDKAYQRVKDVIKNNNN